MLYCHRADASPVGATGQDVHPSLAFFLYSCSIILHPFRRGVKQTAPEIRPPVSD